MLAVHKPFSNDDRDRERPQKLRVWDALLFANERASGVDGRTDGRMDGRALFSGRGGNFGCGRRRTASDETTLIEIGWARRNTSKDFEREGTAETENAKSGRTTESELGRSVESRVSGISNA